MMQGLRDADTALGYMGGGGLCASASTGGGGGGTGGGGGGGGGGPPSNRNRNKQPKPPKGLKSQVSPKIKLCGAKLMDVKLWLNKVKESNLWIDCTYLQHFNLDFFGNYIFKKYLYNINTYLYIYIY